MDAGPVRPVRGDVTRRVEWESLGWRRPRGGAPLLLMLVALVVLVRAYGTGLDAVVEYQRQREQRRDYVAVAGRLFATGGTPEFIGTAPPFGDVGVFVDRRSVPEGTTTLLLAREDPSDYALPADPGGVAAGAARQAAVGLLLAALAGALHRRRPLDLSGVRSVATPLPDVAPPPPPAPGPHEPVGALVWALAFTAVAAAWATTAVDEPPRVRTEQVVGRVVGDRVRAEAPGRFVDRRLTGAEQARGLGEGDELPLTIRTHADPAGEDAIPAALRALLFAAFGAVAAVNGLARPWLLRRLLAAPPRRLDAVAWTVRPAGRDWLFVAPAGATRLGDVVAFRLRRGVRPPAAMAGPLWVHGRPGRWRNAVVRGPDGETYWPTGRSPGWLSATIANAGPAPPVPPEHWPRQPGA